MSNTNLLKRRSLKVVDTTSSKSIESLKLNPPIVFKNVLSSNMTADYKPALSMIN